MAGIKITASKGVDESEMIICGAMTAKRVSIARSCAFHYDESLARDATNPPVYLKGLIAREKILIQGKMRMDSFDSGNPTFSTGALYDPAKFRDNGFVGSNGATENTIELLGEIKIYGSAATAPNGTLQMSGAVAIGSSAWHGAGQMGIQPGRLLKDMDVSFPTVEVPFSSGYVVPSPGNFEGTNYVYLLGSGNYRVGNLNLSGTQKTLVTGNAQLYVPGEIRISDDAFVYIMQGASLKIFAGGATEISGQGVINRTVKAKGFQYYGLPTNTRIRMQGNAPFTGVIYAPEAELELASEQQLALQWTGGAGPFSIQRKSDFDQEWADVVTTESNSISVPLSGDQGFYRIVIR